MSLRKLFYSLILSLPLSFAFLSLVYADGPGDLDPTFGGDGIVTTTFENGFSEGWDIAIQPDNKILVVGSTGSSTDRDLALARYLPDGILDTNFGLGGKVTTPMTTSNEIGLALKLQADNKIVVAGTSYEDGSTDFTLARYNPDGSVDTSFGTSGRVITSISADSDISHDLVIQPDGKIIVIGDSTTGELNTDFALARYNPDGSLDTSFGTNGKIVTPITSKNDAAMAVALQNDAKIIVVGLAFGVFYNDMALARYHSDGSLDSSFGTGGIVTTSLSSIYDGGLAVALQPDGKIIVAGYSGVDNFRTDFALVRYQSNGLLDSSFGLGGVTTTNIGGHASGQAVTLQADGKIVVAGYRVISSSKFALARYQADGSLDTGFGSGGVVTTSISSNHDSGEGVVIQADGKIVVGGYSNYTNGLGDFALVRYLGDASQPDLALNKTVAPLGPAFPGQAITYTLAFSNGGSAVATGIVLTDFIPVGQLADWSYTSNGVTTTLVASSTWQINNLLPGQGGTITLTGRINPALNANTTFTNTAILISSGETITGNNTAQASLGVIVPQAAFSQGAYQAGEATDQAVFTLTLSSPPLAPVTMNYATANGTATAGIDYPAQSGTLTFLTGTTTLTFTLPISDDSIVEGDETLTLTLNSSAGAALAGPGAALLTLLDDDQAGVTLTPTQLTLSEGGESSNFVLTLTSQPTMPITFSLTSNDSDQCTVSPTSLNLAPLAWQQSAIITVTAVDEMIADGDQLCVIQTEVSSPDPNYDDQPVAEVNVLVEDNDDPGIAVTAPNPSTTTEAGGTASFDVVLDTAPTAPVTLTLTSSNPGEALATPATLVFSQLTWNVPQTVTMTGQDDFIDDGDSSYTIVFNPAASADSAYNGLVAAEQHLTNLDDDTAGLVLSTALLTATEGATVSYRLKLNSQPTATVRVNLSKGDEVQLTPDSVLFSPLTWNQLQTVTVKALADNIQEGNHTETISHSLMSTDLIYEALVAPPVVVKLADQPQKQVYLPVVIK